MPDYTTKYVFEFEVSAEKALQEIERLRSSMNEAVGNVSKTVSSTLRGGTTATRQSQQAVQQQGLWIDTFSKQMQDLEVKYFGLRRLSYGLQSTGRDLTQAGSTIIKSMLSAGEGYTQLSATSTKAAIAMEMPIKIQKQMEQSVQDLSETLGNFSAQDLMEGLRIWGMGTGRTVTSTSELNKVLSSTVDISRLAAMNGEDLGTTMDYVGGVMHQFGLEETSVNKISRTLHYQSAKSFASVTDLGEAFKYVGPIAAEAGDSFDELAVVFGNAANAGIKGTTAGRALRQIYLSLLRPTKQVSEQMNELFNVNKLAGESWKDIIFPNGGFVGLYDFIDKVTTATQGMTDAEKEQRLAVLATANELPLLLNMIDLQSKGREKGINYYQAAYKEQSGIIDNEVLLYKKLQEEMTGVPYTIQNATSLWTASIQKWESSDAAAANNLQNRWQNAVDDIGRVIFTEGIGYVEQYTDAFRTLANIIERFPTLTHLGVDVSAVSVAMGGLVTSAGQFLQLLTNILIASQLVKTVDWAKGLTTALASVGITAKGVGLGALAILVTLLVKDVIIDPVVKKQLASLTKTKLEEAPTMTKEELESQIAYYKFRMQAPDLYESGQAEVDTYEEIVRLLQEQLDLRYKISDAEAVLRKEMATSDITLKAKQDIRAIQTEMKTSQLGIQAMGGWSDETFKALQDTYGDVLDAYDDYLKKREETEASYQLQTKRNEEQFQIDLQQFDEDRLEQRGELWRQYNTSVEDTYRQMYRQIELLERQHQQNMADIIEEGQVDRERLIISQAERLADYQTSYALSVSDAYEQNAYSEAQAAEEYTYRKQELIKDYEEWLAEQNKTEEEDEEDKNKRLANLYKDYLKDIKRAREDHLERMWELVARRDARGMLNELKDYNKYLQRRKEDYEDSKNDVLEAGKKEAEQRKRNLEKELADLAEAERRRKELADRAFQRQLFLMERQNQRKLADLAKQNEKELKELQQRIDDALKKEKKGYERSLETLKEEFDYRLKELQREHEAELKLYDYQTYQMKVKLNKRHLELMELYEKHHQEDMALFDENSKAEIRAQLESLELTPEQLQDVFARRGIRLMAAFDKELDWVKQYYGDRLAAIMAEVLGTVSSQTSSLVTTGAGIAGAGASNVGSTSVAKTTTTGTKVSASTGSTTTSTSKTVTSGAGIAGAGASNVGSTSVAKTTTTAVPGRTVKLVPKVPTHITGGSTAFVDALLGYAQAIEKQYGIPALAMLSIAANDTGWGKYCNNYNLFGVKGYGPAGGFSTSSNEEIAGVMSPQVSTFRAYNNWGEAFADFAGNVMQQSNFKSALGYSNVRSFTQALKNGGYATDSRWVDKIVTISSTIQNIINTLKNRASGGWVTHGIYQLGERGPEYVLSNDELKRLGLLKEGQTTAPLEKDLFSLVRGLNPPGGEGGLTTAGVIAATAPWEKGTWGADAAMTLFRVSQREKIAANAVSTENTGFPITSLVHALNPPEKNGWRDWNITELVQAINSYSKPSVPLPMALQLTRRNQSATVIVQQSNWHFDGTFTEADRRWFKRASKDAAYTAISEVLK